MVPQNTSYDAENADTNLASLPDEAGNYDTEQAQAPVENEQVDDSLDQAPVFDQEHATTPIDLPPRPFIPAVIPAPAPYQFTPPDTARVPDALVNSQPVSAPSVITPALPLPYKQAPHEEQKSITTKIPIGLYEKLKDKVDADATTLHAVTLDYFLNYDRNNKAVEQLNKAVAELARTTQQNDQLQQRLQNQSAGDKVINELTVQNKGLTVELDELRVENDRLRSNVASLERTALDLRQTAHEQTAAATTTRREDRAQLTQTHDQALSNQAKAFTDLISELITEAANMPTGELFVPVRQRTRDLQAIAAKLYDKAFKPR